MGSLHDGIRAGKTIPEPQLFQEACTQLASSAKLS